MLLVVLAYTINFAMVDAIPKIESHDERFDASDGYTSLPCWIVRIHFETTSCDMLVF